MKSEKFETILTERLEKIRATLGQKAQEYATDGDRLHNFKRAGEMLKCDPAKALQGFLAKHLVSINDMIDQRNSMGRLWDQAQWDEKIGDAINYLILLEAIVKE